MGLEWRGAQANLSHIGRAAFGYKAVAMLWEIPPPPLRKEPPADIGNMISKENSGSPGDNLDVWA